jgi:tRNA A37 threonylcarbamoyladenosine modification protein TsaB
MQQYNIKIIVISIANPILIGIYNENILIDTITKEGKTSDILPSLFDAILAKYNVEEIFYVNGPGSYMAIKIAYIFLKTISIVNKIDLYALSGFDFNNNSPIKALGKKYFFREIIDLREEISVKFLEDKEIKEFFLPKTLSDLKYSDKILPEYNLPAV